MSDQKAFNRAVRAVWDEIRQERRERRRSLSSADLTASAARLRAFADSFDVLASQAKQAEAEVTPPPVANQTSDEKPARKPKSKAKKAATAKSTKKPKKA